MRNHNKPSAPHYEANKLPKNFEYHLSQSTHKEQEHQKTTTEHLNRTQEHHTAKLDALKMATTIEAAQRQPDHHDRPASPAEKRREPIQIDREFTRAMQPIQQEMPQAQRTFSKFIHNKAVEKTSDFLAVTIARPNAMLTGSIGAFILTLALYLFAKSIGYPLSGFELIATFLLGWVIGLFYDYFRIMITGKR